MQKFCAVAAAAIALLAPLSARAQEPAASSPGAPVARVEVIRLLYADARDIAAALTAIRPPDLQAAVAYVPNNQLITGWGPGGVGTGGFVSGAFGNGFGQRQGGAPPEAMLGAPLDVNPFGGTPPPPPQVVR